jgi:DNA polymerase
MADTSEGRKQQLTALLDRARRCTRCDLCQSRIQVVAGEGNPDADLMFVGEAPGAEEDAQGVPFVGRSGKLLDRALEEAGIVRSDVFITSTLKCRPPGNRDPRAPEIEACRPWLVEQIRLIEPRVVVTLGNFATRLLSGSATGITRIHGRAQVRDLGSGEVLLFPTFHPAAALRSTGKFELLRADLAALPGLLAGDLPAAPTGEHLVSGSPGDTVEIAARVSAGLEPGDVVLLTGPVGAGKSTFARAAMKALGVEGPIPSPTFTIGRLYNGRGGLPVSHLDLYRIGSINEGDPGLLAEYFDPRGIAFVEWPGDDSEELVRQAERSHLVSIEHIDRDRRSIRVEPGPPPRD